MEKKTITYNYEITCEVNEDGVVVPVAGSHTVEVDSNDYENIESYPDIHRIYLIWIGQYYSYPKIKPKK